MGCPYNFWFLILPPIIGISYLVVWASPYNILEIRGHCPLRLFLIFVPDPVTSTCLGRRSENFWEIDEQGHCNIIHVFSINYLWFWRWICIIFESSLLITAIVLWLSLPASLLFASIYTVFTVSAHFDFDWKQEGVRIISGVIKKFSKKYKAGHL